MRVIVITRRLILDCPFLLFFPVFGRLFFQVLYDFASICLSLPPLFKHRHLSHFLLNLSLLPLYIPQAWDTVLASLPSSRWPAAE